MTYGAWINWLAPIAMFLYGTASLYHHTLIYHKLTTSPAIVCLGCLNSSLVKFYVAAISPSQGTVVRVGYFGKSFTSLSLHMQCMQY